MYTYITCTHMLIHTYVYICILKWESAGILSVLTPPYLSYLAIETRLKVEMTDKLIVVMLVLPCCCCF